MLNISMPIYTATFPQELYEVIFQQGGLRIAYELCTYTLILIMYNYL